jgi:hypothetical protein
MSKEEELFESWSIDQPLMEFVDVQAPYVEQPSPKSTKRPAGKNGKPKTARSKSKKKAPRRKS